VADKRYSLGITSAVTAPSPRTHMLALASTKSRTQTRLLLDGLPIGEPLYTHSDGTVAVTLNASVLCSIGRERLAHTQKEIKQFHQKRQHHNTKIRLELTRVADGNALWQLELVPNYNLRSWRHTFSLNSFISEFLARSQSQAEFTVALRSTGFKILFSEIASSKTIQEVFDYCFEAYLSVYKQVLYFLNASSSPSALVSEFDFPVEIRSACEQYLLYFTDFLREMGVEASSELREAGTKVFFSVIPKSRDVALDKIRKALDIFLTIPCAELDYPLALSADSRETFPVLEANVLHLHRMLVIADSRLELDRQIISAQSMALAALANLTTSRPMPAAKSKSSQDEELMGGVVTLSTAEKAGIKINVAEMYRKLKRMLKRNGRPR
jgi:hypothetical protein